MKRHLFLRVYSHHTSTLLALAHDRCDDVLPVQRGRDVENVRTFGESRNASLHSTAGCWINFSAPDICDAVKKVSEEKRSVVYVPNNVTK
ncbi:hypothetical protein EVAR_31473_1 [Eumeta japonica]|uniref:Uncharacterized protein n=1 Tax=Eumeta variegata TaxID=151549 RepID=A0A4C1WA58_EUMVA|nr:hypothetical protein EVAR_31473_1 [Eumeta japonica]